MATVSRAGSRRCGPVLALALATSCSVADNLTYAEVASELDGMVAFTGSGADRRIRYADRAAVSTWYMRWPIFVPIRSVLGFVFGDKAVADIENPSGHVRELIRELPDEVGGDLDAGADGIVRLLQIAEFDSGPANRIVALDSAVAVLTQLEILGLGDPADAGLVTDATRLEAARAGVQLSRPSARPAGGWPSSGIERLRESYRTAVEILVERPLADASDRIALVGDMLGLWRAETDPVLRPAVESALRRAMGHAVRQVLMRTVQGRDARLADVRLCALEQLRRLGGAESVPFLLAIMALPVSATTGFTERFDRDPLVRLRLIHLCGQLRGEEALRAVRLPGRDPLDSIAPADFLAQTVLTERAYYSKLRIPAITALCLSLGRPRLQYEVDWVDAWYRERQRRS